MAKAQVELVDMCWRLDEMEAQLHSEEPSATGVGHEAGPRVPVEHVDGDTRAITAPDGWSGEAHYLSAWDADGQFLYCVCTPQFRTAGERWTWSFRLSQRV